eukprot:TRINITY_DN112355_c0_g1_i1.p1 TRINITY_DN112355_c0_g1~~TRINITY_DN112355_c0_g1_i1.p1  ORF type:complete len:1167 (-),score=190.75 TRINITY_DN112355_c0_g1_i1:120-3620(-)
MPLLLLLGLVSSLRIGGVLAFQPCLCLYGRVDDLGWSHGHNTARIAADKAMGTASIYIEDFEKRWAERDEIIRKFIEDYRCDLIITCSGGHAAATVEWAKQYPGTKFFNLGGHAPASQQNMGASVLKVYQASYIAGAVSAMQLKNSSDPTSYVERLGYVGSSYVSDSISAINAFFLGARSINPNIELNVMHSGVWCGKDQDVPVAERMIHYHNVGLVAYDSDCLDVIDETKQNGIYSIGMKSDINRLKGHLTLMSQVFVWQTIFEEVYRLAGGPEAGWLAGRNSYEFVGFERNALSVGNPSSYLRQEQLDLMNALVANFTAGIDDIFCRPGGWSSVATCPPGAEIGSPLFGGTPPSLIFPCNLPAGSQECLSDSDTSSMTWVLKDIKDHGLLPTCSPGHYIQARSSEICLRCVAGTFSDKYNAASCTECPAGFYAKNSASSECLPCPGGTYRGEPGGSLCTNCGPGRYSDGAAKQCTACPRGTARKQDGGQTAGSCELCPLHTFSNTSGQSECHACGPGLGTFSIASTDATDCTCMEGYYRRGPAGEGCQACPSYMTCAGRNTTPVVTPVHWASEAEPDLAWKCASARTCLGGTVPDICLQGHTGFACSKCVHDWYVDWQSGVCHKCTAGIKFLTIFGALAFIASPFILYHVLKKSFDRRRLSSIMLISTLSSQVLTYMQIMSMVGKFRVDWPASVGGFLRITRLFMLSVQLLAPGCFFNGWGFYQEFPLEVLVPFFFVMILAIYYAGGEGLAKVVDRPGVKMDKDVLVAVCGSVFLVFQTVIVKNCAQYMECYNHDNGTNKMSLLYYPEIFCFSDKHLRMFPIAFLGILCYCVLAFSGILWITWVAPQRFGEPSFVRRYGWLLLKFRPDRWYWAVPLFIRNLLLAFTMAAIPNFIVLQAICMNMILLAALSLTMALQPWREPLHNTFEAVGCVVVFNFSLAALPLAPKTDDIMVQLTVLLFTSTAIGTLFMLFVGGKLVLESCCGPQFDGKSSPSSSRQSPKSQSQCSDDGDNVLEARDAKHIDRVNEKVSKELQKVCNFLSSSLATEDVLELVTYMNLYDRQVIQRFVKLITSEYQSIGEPQKAGFMADRIVESRDRPDRFPGVGGLDEARGEKVEECRADLQAKHEDGTGISSATTMASDKVPPEHLAVVPMPHTPLQISDGF